MTECPGASGVDWHAHVPTKVDSPRRLGPRRVWVVEINVEENDSGVGRRFRHTPATYELTICDRGGVSAETRTVDRWPFPSKCKGRSVVPSSLTVRCRPAPVLAAPKLRASDQRGLSTTGLHQTG
jgi:hypothetical protein